MNIIAVPPAEGLVSTPRPKVLIIIITTSGSVAPTLRPRRDKKI